MTHFLNDTVKFWYFPQELRIHIQFLPISTLILSYISTELINSSKLTQMSIHTYLLPHYIKSENSQTIIPTARNRRNKENQSTILSKELTFESYTRYIWYMVRMSVPWIGLSMGSPYFFGSSLSVLLFVSSLIGYG